MTNKFFTCICLMVLAISCAKPKPQYEITKVELRRVGAWFDRGAVVIIDSSLTYKYHDRNMREGNFTGKVSSRFWDTLNHKFEEIRFKTTPALGYMGTKDAPVFEMIIHWKGGKRRIMRVWDMRADSVLSAFIWLDSSYKNIKLNRVKTHFSFETLYPEVWAEDSVKFPPPIQPKAQK